MKRPKPDVGLTAHSKFINLMKTPRKIKRLWGTSVIDGVEVMNWRQLYYPEPARSENFEKLFKFLGIYEDTTTANMEGVNDAWVYFNRNKLSGTNVVVTPFVKNNLNKLRGNGNTSSYLKTRIAIGTLRNDYDDYHESSILSRVMSNDELVSVITNNYEGLWNTCMIEHSGYGTVVKFVPEIDTLGEPIVVEYTDYLPATDPWLNAIAVNCLRDTENNTVVKRVYKEFIEIPPPKFSNSKQGKEEARYYNTRYRVRYVVELIIPLTTFTDSSPIVNKITDCITNTYSDYSPVKQGSGKNDYAVSVARPNGMVVKSIIQTIPEVPESVLSEEPIPVELSFRSYQEWSDIAESINTIYDALWHKVGKYYYLKADVLQNPKNYGFKYSELNTYIGDILDSGYGKESVPAWKKALAIVVFVVIVYFTRQAQWANLAMAAMIGSLALVLISMSLSELGETEWSMAFAEANQMIEPLVLVANVYLLFTGIGAAYDKAVQAAAIEAGTTASEVTLGQVLSQFATSSADGILSSIVEGARDIATGNITSSASMQFTTQLFEIGNMVQQRRLERISDRNRDLAAEYEDLTKEMNQERDLLKGFAKVYGKPATADWSIYAETYDLPYERGGGPLALGNIQRTTKQAIRKGRYDDPAFENILVV